MMRLFYALRNGGRKSIQGRSAFRRRCSQSPKAQISGGKAATLANALRTTRSTLFTLRAVMALSYRSPKTEGGRVYKVDRLLRRRCSQSPKAQISGGANSPNALRTTRSTLFTLRDDAAFLSLSENASAREQNPWTRPVCYNRDCQKRAIVAVKGGHIVDRKTLREQISLRLGPVEIQIDEDLFIAPVTEEEREGSMLYSNHSCDPNLGMRGEITFVAMRHTRAGEELTHDWATTDDDDYSVECKCGAPNCRKILTGKDWQRADLQKRYAGYFSAYLADKIAARCR